MLLGASIAAVAAIDTPGGGAAVTIVAVIVHLRRCYVLVAGCVISDT